MCQLNPKELSRNYLIARIYLLETSNGGYGHVLVLGMDAGTIITYYRC